MSIEKMMCLSTGHVSAKTADALNMAVRYRGVDLGDDAPTPWVGMLPVYPHGEYGWLFAVGDTIDCHTTRAHMPHEFLAILDLCEKEGCCWLLLDRDADLLDTLPTYDW